MKKPDSLEKRKLGSERNIDKKFTVPRRILANNFTKFNYYFNAHRINNEVLEKATKTENIDYAKLLDFYPYSYQSTKTYANDLDSVIIKCNEGILLHDLRSDWVDNMYLELGKAYLYKNDWDTAAGVFQFMIANLYPKKKRKNKDEADPRFIGSNENDVLSISSKEKLNIMQKMFALPPSRNDAYIFLLKALGQQKNFGEAMSLTNILANDKQFPARLKAKLNEEIAHLYYLQANYDSASLYLEKALPAAENKIVKNWWYFLLAQLFDKTGNEVKAFKYFDKAIGTSLDPEMDIYARVYKIKATAGKTNSDLLKTVAQLEELAKKSRFDGYEDLVYLAAADLAVDAQDEDRAILNYNRSVKVKEPQAGKRYINKAYLALGNLYFRRKDYINAHNSYDSIKIETLITDSIELERLKKRSQVLSQIVPKLKFIEKQDSLMRLAAMPDNERDLLIRNLVRKLRKEKGLKDETTAAVNTGNPLFKTDEFGNLNNSAKDWYFASESRKQKGFQDFKAKWGEIPNVDNWRRSAVVNKFLKNTDINSDQSSGLQVNNNTGGGVNAKELVNEDVAEITFEALKAQIPITTEEKSKAIGKTCLALDYIIPFYYNDLKDYENTIAIGKRILENCNNYDPGKISLMVSESFNALGNNSEAEKYRRLAFEKYPNSLSVKKINNPTAENNKNKNPQATELYQKIYNLYLSGNYKEAYNLKQKADKQFGTNYWSPQLLYIQAVYQAKIAEDSAALQSLNDLISLYPESKIVDKAKDLLEAIKNRKKITGESAAVKPISKTDVAKNNNNNVSANTTAPKNNNPKTSDTVTTNSKPKPVVNNTNKTNANLAESGYVVGKSPINVFIYFPDLDPLYARETKIAVNRFNRQEFSNQNFTLDLQVFDGKQQYLTVGIFLNEDAVFDYLPKLNSFIKNELIWLPQNQYQVMIITAKNLDNLKQKKDIQVYKQWLKQNYPDKF